MGSNEKQGKNIEKMTKKQSTNFLVSIYHTDNHSIQGVVQWLDTGKKVSFRSDFELLMLMNEALGTMKEKEVIYRHWNDDHNTNAI